MLPLSHTIGGGGVAHLHDGVYISQIVPSSAKVYNHTEQLGLRRRCWNMLRTKTIEDRMRKGRPEAKTLDGMFRRRIEEGASG